MSDINAAQRLLFVVGSRISMRLGVIGSRISMRLGVSCVLSDLGYQCGSASPVGYWMSDINAARFLCVIGSRISMRLGVAWALFVIGFPCGSASLGRRLSLDGVDADGF